MSWHYRVRKKVWKGTPLYDLVEYYNDGPFKGSWTENGIAPGGETCAELIAELEMMLKDAKRYKILVEKESK